MIPIAWFGALWLRFNLDTIPAAFLEQAFRVLPVLVVVQGGTFLYFGLYRGVWRFASVPDLVRIVQAAVVGVSLCAVAAFLLTRHDVHIPRASFPLYAGLLMVLLSGPRLAYRWFKDRRPARPAPRRRPSSWAPGRAGENLARALLRDPSQGVSFRSAFVDDDPDKNGRDHPRYPGPRPLRARSPRLPRTPSAGMRSSSRSPSASHDSDPKARRAVRAGESCRCEPWPQHGWISYPAALAPGDLRAITIEDLLNRKPVQPDWSA